MASFTAFDGNGTAILPHHTHKSLSVLHSLGMLSPCMVRASTHHRGNCYSGATVSYALRGEDGARHGLWGRENGQHCLSSTLLSLSKPGTRQAVSKCLMI